MNWLKLQVTASIKYIRYTKIHKVHQNTQKKRIKILCECITGKESGSHYSKNVLYNGDQKWLLVLKNGMHDERGIFSIALHTLSNF